MKVPNHVFEHVETIAKQEMDFRANRSAAERLADGVAGFAGSLSFVMLHLIAFSAWMILNSPWFPHLRHIDPMPYPLLDTAVAIEALLLASFILMRQSSLARRADEREHLMLQMLLLTEREVSAIIRANREIAEKIGIATVSEDPELQELAEPTSVEDMARTIQDKIAGN